MIHPSTADGYEFVPTRSSGIHCTRCNIVFAHPAPPLDINGERICCYCIEAEKRDRELAEKLSLNARLF